MSLNLSEEVKSYFNNEFINEASRNLHEEESGITKALSVIVPSIIGFISKYAGTADGAAKIGNLANEQHASGILRAIGGFLHHDTGAEQLQKSDSISRDLFGEQGKNLGEEVSNFSGIKDSSASTLYNIALPTILGLLGRHLTENKLDVSYLTSYFSTQNEGLAAALPAEPVVSSPVTEEPPVRIQEVPVVPPVPAAHHTIEHHDHAHHDRHDSHEEPKNPIKSFSWTLPLIIIIIILLGLWWFLGRGKSEHHEQTIHDTTITTVTKKTETVHKGKVDPNGDFIYDEGDFTTITLPNNAGELKVGKYSTEANLVAFLNDKNTPVDTAKGNWFEFTNVHFKTNSSDLTDVSNTQLKNLVAITKAYPNAKFKFGGYTDNTGNEAANIALSAKRAESVAALVTKFGGNPAAFEAPKGYGPAFPIADNSTPEGRAQNRRVAINVKAK